MLLCRTVFIFFLAICAHFNAQALPNDIKLGVILEEDDGELEKEILKILDNININDTVLPFSRLLPIVIHIKFQDRFHALKAVCNLSGEGVVAILASVSPSVNTILQSAAQSLHIPHLEIQPNYRSFSANYSVNLYPDPAIFSKALLDLVEFKTWRSFTVLYQDHDSVLKIQDLFNAGFRIHLQIIQPEENLKKIFKDLSRQGETHFILDLRMNRIRDVFRQAEDLGIMTEYHNYILTSFDFQAIQVDEFRRVKCNISGFSFLPSGQQTMTSAREPWHQRHEERLHYGQRSRPSFKVRNAVLHDTLVLLARALHDLDNSQSVHVEKLQCDPRKPWSHGRSVINYMKMINIIGETGIVKLDENGRRVDFVLDIMDVKRRGLMRVASWTIRSGMKAIHSPSRDNSDHLHRSSLFKNKTLLVTTLLNPPYITVNERRKGDDRFEGFCADLLKEMSFLMGFRYEIRLVRDNSYGHLNERGEWNGMIRELVDKEADLAVADLTITSQRAEVVDFTMPFMNLGISILYKRPKGRQKNPFIFFSSLSVDVWIFTLGAYVLASLMMYVTARFSPSEWERRRGNASQAITLHNKFGFSYCFWFTLSAIMRQGCQVTPRSPPTRLAALSWWFFTLIMISSYTANFAAFLTVERFYSPIENVDDLSKQTKIHYGCVNTGSTRSFFENSQLEIYKGMWEFMSSTHPNVLVSSNSEGVDRVLKTNYAFLMESSSIEYAIESHCELTQIGGLLDSKSYGLATPMGSPYSQLLTKAILVLQEDGTLHRLKERWWKVKNNNRENISCPVEMKGVKSVNELGLYSIGGVFVVLLAGLGVSCLSVIVEIVYKHHRKISCADK